MKRFFVGILFGAVLLLAIRESDSLLPWIRGLWQQLQQQRTQANLDESAESRARLPRESRAEDEEAETRTHGEEVRTYRIWEHWREPIALNECFSLEINNMGERDSGRDYIYPGEEDPGRGNKYIRLVVCIRNRCPDGTRFDASTLVLVGRDGERYSIWKTSELTTIKHWYVERWGQIQGHVAYRVPRDLEEFSIVFEQAGGGVKLSIDCGRLGHKP